MEDEKFECPECGEVKMKAISEVSPSGQQTFECEECGFTTSYP